MTNKEVKNYTENYDVDEDNSIPIPSDVTTVHNWMDWMMQMLLMACNPVVVEGEELGEVELLHSHRGEEGGELVVEVLEVRELEAGVAEDVMYRVSWSQDL